MRQIIAAKQNLTGCRFDQPQDCAAEGRLAAAGFTNQSERLALENVQRHAIDGFHDLRVRLNSDRPHGKVHLKILN